MIADDLSHPNESHIWPFARVRDDGCVLVDWDNGWTAIYESGDWAMGMGVHVVMMTWMDILKAFVIGGGVLGFVAAMIYLVDKFSE